MKLIFFLAFRNLFRQKRRSLLLGVAITFGMMILVIANSFSRGISDNIFNRMIVYMAGHMEVSIMENSKQYSRVIRDKERFISLIRKNVPDIKEIVEAIGTLTRVVGNGKSELSVVVGIIDNKENRDYFNQYFVAGNINDFYSNKIENPTILYEDKARALNVKVGDTVKVKLKTVSGQTQSARLTVTGILQATNIFESFAIYVDLHALKKLLAMRPYETGALQINFNRLNDPAFAIKQAEKMYKLLQPEVAVIHGNIVTKRRNSGTATMLGFFNSEKEMTLLKKNIVIKKGIIPDAKNEKKAMISAGLAERIKVKVGDIFTYSYKPKFEKENIDTQFTVGAIFDSKYFAGKDFVLLNENDFYKLYLDNLPSAPPNMRDVFIPKKSDALFAAFSPEWRLLERSSDHDSLQKKINDMQKTKWKGPWMDVRTMYESASPVLKLESALKLITFIAVLILFFIILVGVVNSLRMTIRERTREIGTVRAIGMQESDVRNLFIVETLLLSFFACIAGIILGIILMKLTGLITIHTDSVFSILLVERHLYFLPDVFSIVGNVLLILIMSGLTAFFPARRAGKLSAAVALRHYE
jgi:ABC-type lipoprotein release transport system permease subunit